MFGEISDEDLLVQMIKKSGLHCCGVIARGWCVSECVRVCECVVCARARVCVHVYECECTCVCECVACVSACVSVCE